MRHVIKNTSKITFSYSCKNVIDRSSAKERVLARNVVIRSTAKLSLSDLCFYFAPSGINLDYIWFPKKEKERKSGGKKKNKGKKKVKFHILFLLSTSKKLLFYHHVGEMVRVSSRLTSGLEFNN